MKDKDQLLRFIFDNLDIRGELVTLDSTWKEVLARYDYPDTVQQLLGEAMGAVAILSSTIKYEGSLILQVQGDGPLSTLVVQASNDGNLRGLAKWKADVPKGALSTAFGQGQIVITIKHSKGEPYQSIVPLLGENLSEALEHYFVSSEQLKSQFWMFVTEEKVTGLFLQVLPSQSEGNEGKENPWERITTLANTITAEELLNLSPENMLQLLFHEEQVRVFEPKPLCFKCTCSKEKIEGTLISLGQATLNEILEENKQQGKIEIDCEFCNQHYEFSSGEIMQLLIENKKIRKQTDPTLH